ncbi:MAG: DMT family transporter, partial [Alphaproteobacteria bacterium]|nr:DMT family transporter [Alphaproteobacteria bacterium]
LVLAAMIARGQLARLREIFTRPVLLRTAAETCGTFTYLIALFHIPIANATAIHLSSPLMLTAAAALFLRETVGWRRWSAVMVGFAGIVLIIRPGVADFDAWALFAVLATFCVVARDLMTRRLPANTPTIVIVAGATFSAALFGALYTAIEGWREPPAEVFIYLFASATFLVAGHALIVVTMRIGEVSAVVPYRYSALLWALGLGYLLWGQLPGGLGWVGIGLLVGSGLYVLHRERVRSRSASRG